MRARRDPFARVTYRPTREPRASHCAWCGQRPAPRHPLYTIRMEHDTGRTDEVSGGHFDTWSCAEAYHDVRIGRP